MEAAAPLLPEFSLAVRRPELSLGRKALRTQVRASARRNGPSTPRAANLLRVRELLQERLGLLE